MGAPSTGLKSEGLPAESFLMDRGGTGLRRRIVVLAMVAALGTALGPETTAAAATGLPQMGETGSGPAPFPVEIPGTASPRGAGFRWSDLDGSDAWAKRAIDFVGKSHAWMRDFGARPDGTVPFKPDMIQTRKYLARAVVKAFAPAAQVDPQITFTDLDPSQSFYKWANIAVQRGWMKRSPDGRFLPDHAVSTSMLHAVLIDVVGMRGIARQLDGLHTRDGVRFPTPPRAGAMMLGLRLGLRYNNSNESMDVGPKTPLSRAQVAYSLYKVATLPSWVVPWVSEQYDGIELPRMGPRQRAIVKWGMKFIGLPYVWGGEWGLPNPPASLGGQAVPGFDCSGLVWWLVRANEGSSWRVHPPRPYAGWSLPQRTSAEMSRFGSLRYKGLLPGDLMFYDGNGDGTVDHVNVYIGKGYALDSSNTPGGVTIMWVGDGWYRDHFVHGRRVLPAR
jgi:cell wall-associated NlpC family hydrolase